MGSEARARIGLWGMLVAALFSFNQVFGDADYPGPAILGMLLASGIVILLRRAGLGTIVTSAVAFLGLTWYLSLIFEAKNTFWSLPTRASLLNLSDSVARAHQQSQIDFAPVPLRPGYAIMVVGALWIAVTLGEIATFRWRRPLIATVLPLALFVVSLVVGSGDASTFYVLLFLVAVLTYWGLEASHRLRSWGRWVGAWSHHKAHEPQSLTGGMARRLGASCVLAAVISPLFLPALEDGLVSWRSGVGSGSGEGTSGRVNPWASLQPQLVNQSGEVLFRVKAERAEYWRLISLEDFDGVDWSEDSTERTDSEDGVIGGDFSPSPTDTKPFTQEVVIEGLEGSALPAAVSPSIVRGPDEDFNDAAGFSFDAESRAAFFADGLENGDTFKIESALLDVDYEELVRAEAGELGPPTSLYHRLPEPLSEDVQALIARWTRGAETDFEKLVAIQNELRNVGEFKYSLTPNLPSPGGSGRDYLTAFLVDVKAGYCQQYAAAFAAIARQLGYPSRVSVGFLPGDQNSITGEFTVAGTDAHAWPEVYFERFGWIRFEATPRLTANTPAYTEPPTDESGPQVPVGVAGPAAEAAFNGGTGGRGGGAFDDAPGGNGPINPDGAQNAGRGAAGLAGEKIDKEWQKTFARILAVLLAATFAFLLLVPVLKELKSRRRYSSAGDPDGLAAAAFAQFQDEAADLALPRRASESASTYARRMASSEKVAERSALRLAAIYEAAAFAGEDISPQQAAEARRLAQRMRSQLWATASWGQRAARLFSPRHLRAS